MDDLAIAGAVAATPSSTLGTAVAGIVADLGGLALFLGFLVLVLAVAPFLRPYSHVGLGIAILVLAFVCLFVGGGFYVGTVLGAIGGIMAIVFESDEDTDDLPEWSRSSGPGWTPAPLSRRASPPANAPPAGPKIGCSNCGEIEPSEGAVHRRKCGASLSQPVPGRPPS